VIGSSLAQAQSSGSVYNELGPNFSNQERLVTRALMTATVPSEVLQGLRPPLPQIVPFPMRFGYPDYPDRQADMRQVLDVDRYYRNRRDDISGGVAGWQAASRNIGVHDVW
jgi:hypothetical protein